MTYPLDNVSSAADQPTHHVKLSDASGNKVLMRLVRAGRRDSKTSKTVYEDDPESLTRNTVPNQAIRMTGQGGEYVDLQPPWQAYEQKTWSGGRGKRYFHEDKTRFDDQASVLSQVENQLTLAGLPAYTGGQLGGDVPHEDYALMPNASSTLVGYLNVYGSALYVARQFTPTYNYSCDAIILALALIGTAPGDVYVYIYTDSGSNAPGASLAFGTLPATSFGTEEKFQQHRVALDSSLALVAGTLYWVVVKSGTDGDASNYWQVLAEALSATSAKQSTTGIPGSWGATPSNRAPCVVLCDAGADEYRYKYFEYKRQLYAISVPQTEASTAKLYRNGWRGAADSNTGALNKLKDATQITWSASIPNGGIVLITKGPGSEEAQPWRQVTGSASGELTVSPPWRTTHTTETEYVVLGTNYWDSLMSTSAYLTDAVVLGDFMYLCYGNHSVMRRIWEYNNAGTWTLTSTTESLYAHKIMGLSDATAHRTLAYAYNNNHALGPVYWRMYQPPAWGSLYRPLGDVLGTNIPWNDKSIANVTQSVGQYGTKVTIASGFTSGLIATKDLDSPLNIAQGQKVGVLMNSDVAVTTGQLTLRLSSRPWLQQQDATNAHKRLADFVYHRKLDRLEVAEYAASVDGDFAPTALGEACNGVSGSVVSATFTTTVGLVVIFSKKVDYVRVRLGSAKNNNAATLAVAYFNGEEFTAVNNLDDHTDSGGATFAEADGYFTFALPGHWEQYTLGGTTGYALYLTFSAALDAVDLAEISGKNTEGYSDTLLSLAKDASAVRGERVIIKSGDSLFFGMANEIFDGVLINMDATARNTAAATMSGKVYFDGELFSSVTVTDGTSSGGATLTQDGELSFTPPSDWQKISVGGNAGYYLGVTFSADLTYDSGNQDDLLLLEVSTYLIESTYDVDCVLSANTWTWVTSSVTPGANPPDGMIVRNISLILKADLGAQTIEMKDGVQLISPYPEYHLTNGQRMTNIIGYGQGDQILQPHILFEAQRPHRIDTLNDDLLVPILVTAMETLADESNGRAACHSGVYLYFNMGPRLMRYFEGSLESVGPDLDEGLPYFKQGVITEVIPYAGDKVIFAVSAGARDPLFTSTVYLRSGSGVHELYRAPVGESIDSLQVQVVPGLASDRLWIGVGSQLVSVPLSSYTTNPLKDLNASQVSNFYYLHDGHLDLGYFTDGALGLEKVFVSITLVTENLSNNATSPCWIDVYYRLDEDTAWTKIGTQITTSPVQEVKFANGYVTGKALQVRLRLHNHGGVKRTPVVKAVFVKGVTIYPPTYQYVMQVLIGDYAEDLDGRRTTHKASVEMAQLDNWRANGTPLTMNNLMVPWDVRNVILNSIDGKVAMRDEVVVRDREQYLLQLALIDITVGSGVQL